MGKTFEPTEDAKAAWPTASKEVERAAFDMVDDFISMNMGNREATSLVAHMLVRTAWIIAGTGRISVGETPNPDAFIGVAEQAVVDIKWPSLDSVKEGE